LASDVDVSVIESNLRATMRFFGQASGCGDIQEREGLLLIDSGVNYGVFNMALLDGRVESRQDFEHRISVAQDYFQRRGARWSFWLCDDLLTPAVLKRAAAAFEIIRLRRLTEAPGMIAERLAPQTRPLPEIEYRRVKDAATRSDFSHVTSLNFDIPYATCRMIYETECAWSHDYAGYVGYVGGQAVTTVAVVVAAGAIGVYSVGTLQTHRRRGYGEALMRRVLDECTRQTGIERTVLQATRAGYPMYRKMGYREATRFTVYIS
jgi:GNAT superfamily N-acetyltransferase